MPGASAPRVEDGGEVRPSRAELAGVRQEAATPAGRRDPTQETRGSARQGIHLASCAIGGPAGRVDRHGVGGQGRQAADQTTEAASRRVADLPGRAGGAVRQQPRREGNSARSDDPQEQFRQPKRSWCRHPGGADECLPHAPAARTRPTEDGGRCPHDLPLDRETTSATGKSYYSRLKSYGFPCSLLILCQWTGSLFDELLGHLVQDLQGDKG